MVVEFKKQFLKDLSKLPKDFRKKIEDLIFEHVPNESRMNFESRISKMVGYDFYYKIRIGDYRIGLLLKENSVEFQRVLHRKEIYKFFP